MPTISCAWTDSVTPGHAPPAAAGDRDLAQLEHRAARLLRIAARQGHRAADHRLGDGAGAGRGDVELGDLAPGAQHGDAPAQPHHLVELVADEQDREPASRQPRQGREQPLGLLRRQHGGRLVEDQHAHVAVERLRGSRPAAARRPRGWPRRRPAAPRGRRSAISSTSLRRAAPTVAPPAPERLGAQHDIVEHRQVGGQGEVLVHHADARRQRRVRRARRQRSAAPRRASATRTRPASAT